MGNNLNKSDLEFILESQNHPDYEFKQKRLKEVDKIIEKVGG